MKTRNFKLQPVVKKKSERDRDIEKVPDTNPLDNLPFKYVWAMSVPGEECGNPFVSKCPGKKFKARTPCILSKVNGRVFHFPRCWMYAELTQEELDKKKRKKSANNRVKSVPEQRLS